MRVEFTKGPGTSYEIAVHRETGAALAPRNGPGGHPYLPHDLLHLLAEIEAGIPLGVFGQLAAGDNGLFWPADPAERTKAARRRKIKATKMSPQEKADMARSEELVGVALPVWEYRRGHAGELPPSMTDDAVPPLVERIVARFDDYADRWYSLRVGDTLSVTW
ncbi:hypothetical protein ACFWCF_07365 [Rhodococcus sp. NPDC060090]|uniref:hypothetical protein n=1 Tax=Rhodococcus sp. NPDC060090 TaxID=3347056 RepID=UPI003664C17D